MRGTPTYLIQLVCLSLAGTALWAQEPGPNLIREIAAKESEFKAARDQYTYRQTILFEELDSRGAQVGSYREVRDITFSPQKERTEVLVGRPRMSLKRLQLTEEDFRDVREIKPFVLTTEDLRYYQIRFQGVESMDGVECFVFRLKPRQILEGQRLFDGKIWVSRKDQQIVRAEGQPVPAIYREKTENLFPHFTTIYRPIDGKYWFPVRTLADDTLPFRSGPQRVRLTIRYEDYRRFAAESTIEYQGVKPN
jgi:hypothetical protein